MELDEAKPKASLVQKIAEAKSAISKAQQSHDEAISDLYNKLGDAEAKYRKSVADAQKRVESAASPYSSLISSVGKVSLYGDRIDCDGTIVPLSEHIEIEISASGNGATGAAAEGQKNAMTANGNQKLFLSVIGETESAVAELDPSAELDARQLAAKAKLLSRSVEKRRKEIEQPVSEAQAALEAAKADTKDIDQIKKQIEQAKQDTTAIDEAQATYDDLLDSIDEEDLDAEIKRTKMAGISKWWPFVAIFIAAALAFWGFWVWISVPQNVLMGIVLWLIADALVVSAFSIRRDITREAAGKHASLLFVEEPSNE